MLTARIVNPQAAATTRKPLNVRAKLHFSWIETNAGNGKSWYAEFFPNDPA
jgi:hypothetical protein